MTYTKKRDDVSQLIYQSAKAGAERILKQRSAEGSDAEDLAQDAVVAYLELKHEEKQKLRSPQAYGRVAGRRKALSARKAALLHQRLKWEQEQETAILYDESVTELMSSREWSEERAELRAILDRVQEHCSPRDYEILRYQVEHDCDASEVAKHFATTAQAVHAARYRVKKKALEVEKVG